MAQLNVKLSDEQMEEFRRYAKRRRTPASWLMKDYIEYLLAGGRPVIPPSVDAPTGADLASLAQAGRAFDWLAEEPELYSPTDGEPM